jgi:hypothetical protein
MIPAQRERLGRLLGYLWICALTLSLLLAAHNCYRRCNRIREYAYACDAFGYLMMAKEIRQAAAARELPTFQLESPQIRLLVDFMRSRNVPLQLWNEMVAPHAHHYFPTTGYVGVQYPPGTGLALAVFPEGDALHRLNVAVIDLMVAVGLIGMVIAAWRRAWISAGCLILALELGMEVLQRIGGLSFSVNAVMAPLLLSSICAFAVLVFEADVRMEQAAPVAALMAGIFLGFGILTRLPVILLAPGFVVLLWSAPWQKSFLKRVFPFGIGMTLTGIVPVLVEQSRVAGAWYLPTYGPADAAPPSLAPLWRNISYYLGRGPGSDENLLLLAILAGFVGLTLASSSRDSRRLSMRRLVLAAAALWGIPAIYFLTHQIAIPYYMVPASFGAAMVLALGASMVELLPAQPSDDDDDPIPRLGKLRWIAFVVAILPGLVAVTKIRSRAESSTRRHPEHFRIPAELSDDRGWVWADLLTGSLRYYGNKTAFKVPFSDPATRELAYKFVFDRSEPQYIIVDSPTMSDLLDEMKRMGAVPQFRGSIAAKPYFLLDWPSGGPHPISASLPAKPPSPG